MSSDIFITSPSQARLLKYLAQNHFSEERANLNEYRIGVEALGRPADFDPAKSSSVRVDIHRLRIRLRKYYESEGANHPLTVVLEDGRYALRFEPRLDQKAATSDDKPDVRPAGNELTEAKSDKILTAPVVLKDLVDEDRKPRSRFRLAFSAVILALLLVATIVSYWMWERMRSHARNLQEASDRQGPAIERAAAVPPETDSIRILAGYLKEKYVDREGRTWGGDRFFSGGEPTEQDFSYILGTNDPTMYRTARSGDFSYDIPVKSIRYELRLHFAETTFGPGTTSGGGESSRVFSVYLGDRPVLQNFDVLSDAGGNDRVYTRVFRDVSPDSDGKIHIRFHHKVQQPFVNAIELVPEVGNRTSPILMVMQEDSYVDRTGRLWMPDQYAVGGMLITHHKSPVNAPDPRLFDGERFGHFLYQIPLAPGRYSVTFYLSESYFGTDSKPEDGDGRLFDIFANGEALVHEIDIAKQAGGPRKGLSLTFHGLKPNAAGLLVLSFVPVKNYAVINALAVVEESKYQR